MSEHRGRPRSPHSRLGAAAVSGAQGVLLGRCHQSDYEPSLRWDANDVRFRFPGDSSWACGLQDTDELEKWPQRLVRVGLQFYD
jgi:hypothetical protein